MLETIGDHYAVFLKGHGIVVSEQTIEGNAVSAIRLERAARDQILPSSFSQPKPLTDGARGRDQISHGPSLPNLALSPVPAWDQIKERSKATHPLYDEEYLARRSAIKNHPTGQSELRRRIPKSWKLRIFKEAWPSKTTYLLSP